MVPDPCVARCPSNHIAEEPVNRHVVQVVVPPIKGIAVQLPVPLTHCCEGPRWGFSANHIVQGGKLDALNVGKVCNKLEFPARPFVLTELIWLD